MTSKKLRAVRPDHQSHPLRRIIRREIQNGRPFVVLACNHSSPGTPASRASRFYPCPLCADTVERYRRSTHTK